MDIVWRQVYLSAFSNLQTNPRPKILVIHQFTSPLVAIELSKIGSWDISFIAYLAPYTVLPQSQGSVFYTKWKRLYIGHQLIELNQVDILSGLEIKPKLWVPDLTIKIWEGVRT